MNCKPSKQTAEPRAPAFDLVSVGGLLFLILVAVVSITAPQRPTSGETGQDVQTSAPESGVPPEPGPTTAEKPAKPGIERADDSPLADLQLSMKLDPRLTRGLYMGDRWVSPPTYTRVGDSTGCTVEVKVQGIDTHGKPVAVTPQWTVADAEQVTVSAGPDNAIHLTVQRAGQSSVEVAALGFTKRLALNATEQNGVLTLELSQPESPPIPTLANTAAPLPAGVWSRDLPQTPGQSVPRHRHRRGEPVPIPEELNEVVAQIQTVQQQLAEPVPTAPSSTSE